jgi:hypothetical protein
MNAGIGISRAAAKPANDRHPLNAEAFLLSSDILLNKLSESLNPLTHGCRQISVVRFKGSNSFALALQGRSIGLPWGQLS